ncbi:MAG: hypothetical protein FGF50_01535 [Candidatus Brockarchaeota archaeon]|nr:hypothetical protein [Candidatus Brockarchaeota archaeon]
MTAGRPEAARATIICLRLQYASDAGKVADTMHLNQEQALKLQSSSRGRQ